MNQSYEFMSSGQGRQQKDHNISMKGRKTLEITGVKQVESFDNEEFLLETEMGYLSIRGQHLQMKNLDVDEGNVSIQGRVDDLVYLDQHSGDKSKGFFGKLFK
ncbi:MULTISPECIES: sporulation protein YabP [Alteribacter]|nr:MULTISPECIES: sporulation protein YabP [Alteribacter]MBM7097946.1 sporulation protein YabP [Alteribacter salitolerans]